MEMSALTFLSWEVMSALGWLFLVVGGAALVVGSAVVGTGGWSDACGWLASGGTAGAGRLDLTINNYYRNNYLRAKQQKYVPGTCSGQLRDSDYTHYDPKLANHLHLQLKPQ